MQNKEQKAEQLTEAGMAQNPLLCACCGKSDDEQAVVEHGDELWCLDCMRIAGHCITCDDYIPKLVEDYYSYEADQCPVCVRNGA